MSERESISEPSELTNPELATILPRLEALYQAKVAENLVAYRQMNQTALVEAGYMTAEELEAAVARQRAKFEVKKPYERIFEVINNFPGKLPGGRLRAELDGANQADALQQQIYREIDTVIEEAGYGRIINSLKEPKNSQDEATLLKLADLFLRLVDKGYEPYEIGR